MGLAKDRINQIVKQLILDVHVRQRLGGWTPLHFAAASGHSEICAMLIRAGGVVDQESYTGRPTEEVI